MESVGLSIENRKELDQLLVALLQRRDAGNCTKEEIHTIDTLVGRLNWDTAAAELEAA